MIRKKKYKNIYDGPLVDWFDEIIKENYNDEQTRLREENIRLNELNFEKDGFCKGKGI